MSPAARTTGPAGRTIKALGDAARGALPLYVPPDDDVIVIGAG